MAGNSTSNRSGTTGTPDLRLAEIILLRGGRQRLHEVEILLRNAGPALNQRIMRDVVFRFLLASARLAHLRAEPRAADLAREALAVAAEAALSIPRHPDVGRPSATSGQLAELHRIAGNR
jgi:hypothetical protein